VGTEQFIGSIKQVEIHDTDPTTDPPDDPWDSVSANFATLGDRLKSTDRKVADDGGPGEEEIRSAFATLIGAWDQVAGSVSDALRDPETRQQLKNAASSFAIAVGSTLSDLGSEFSHKPGRSEEE
jgi:hypothetical protein